MLIKIHYLRELLGQQKMTLERRDTSEMVADLLTKALGKRIFEKLRGLLLEWPQLNEECWKLGLGWKIWRVLVGGVLVGSGSGSIFYAVGLTGACMIWMYDLDA